MNMFIHSFCLSHSSYRGAPLAFDQSQSLGFVSVRVDSSAGTVEAGAMFESVLNGLLSQYLEPYLDNMAPRTHMPSHASSFSLNLRLVDCRPLQKSQKKDKQTKNNIGGEKQKRRGGF